jgi:hypothetical protein
MASLTELISAIPQGSQYNLIKDALIRVDRTFPEKMAEIDLARVQKFVSDVDNGIRSASRIRNDIFKYIVGEETIMERLGVDSATAQQLIAGTQQFALNQDINEAGDLATSRRGVEIHSAPLTILFSPSLKWYKDPKTNLYYASYKLPNSAREYIFEAEHDQMLALFGQQPPPAENVSFAQLTGRDTVTFGGNIAEMQGRGSFDTEFARIKATALDNGMLPEWIRNDPAAMDFVVIAHLEGKSNEWTIEQVSKLPSFKARFPGIEAFKSLNMTTSEAVGAFLEYESNLIRLERMAGRDGSRVTPSIVGGLATKGYAFEHIEQTYAVFKRMNDYAPALDAFNQILVANGQNPLVSTADKYNFLMGNAPSQIYDIYEASSFREAATQAGLGDVFSASDAMNAALQTPGQFSLAQATKGMQQAAQLALRLRHEIDIGSFGLDVDELIDVSLGFAPRSGRVESDIAQGIERAVQAGRAFVEGQRAKPFTGFSDSGTPQQRSLGNLRQQR